MAREKCGAKFCGLKSAETNAMLRTSGATLLEQASAAQLLASVFERISSVERETILLD
jgi:hypothetical protein